jgi:response regulator RpfG family c-di-GMP phosphodiesterase
LAIVEKFKKYYKLLPVQLTIVNEKAAQIAGEIYAAAIENNSFADNEAFHAGYEHRLEKYIVYYDIGKTILECGDIKINRTATEHEMQANRKYMTILEEEFKDAKLSAEDEICKEILYAAVEKNEQYDGMGFPKCLKGQNISPVGRILAVSDYIARKFIDGTAEKDLITKLKLKLGKKYDPDVVELAIGVIERLYEREKAAIPEKSEEFRSIQMLYQPVCDATGGVAKEYASFGSR